MCTNLLEEGVNFGAKLGCEIPDKMKNDFLIILILYGMHIRKRIEKKSDMVTIGKSQDGEGDPNKI
jgi:hypothetical protein